MSHIESQFTSLAGTVLEEARFVAARRRWPLRSSPGGHELRLGTAQGRELVVRVPGPRLPAARGQRVLLFLQDHHVVGLFNGSTSEAVNCAREHPSTLMGGQDVLVALAVSAGAALALDAMGLWAGAVAWLLLWVGRRARRWFLQELVDAVLFTLQPDPQRKTSD